MEKPRTAHRILTKADIAASVRVLSREKRFAVIARRLPKPELTHSTNAFRSLARSIIYQQISGRAAASIEKKFVALYPRKRFPSPDDLLSTSLTRLRKAGVSPQKGGYLIDLAQKFKDKTVDPKHFHLMTDAEISEHVIRVKGIGQWTADMFLIFALNRGNVLPVGDLGIQKGAQLFFALRSLPSPERLRALAEPFDGHLTVFSLYLWNLADEAKNKT